MKIYFKPRGKNYWTAESDSTVCKDFENYKGIIWSKRLNSDHEYGTHFQLIYNNEYNDIMLYCQPDYDETELIGIKFCPWCGEKIEFELRI